LFLLTKTHKPSSHLAGLCIRAPMSPGD
jgi:hypothetical protein